MNEIVNNENPDEIVVEQEQLDPELMFSNKRLEGESYETYKLRRKLLNRYYKQKMAPKLIHKSSSLIPLLNKEGKAYVNRQTGQPIWIGKTKGVTYIKPKEQK